MNENEFRSLFPNCSTDALRRNADLQAGDRRATAKPERVIRDGALGEKKVQRPTRRRFLVCIETIRKRLLDEDNIVSKFHVDLLRYAGVISGDEAHTTAIETRQRKARADEREQIIIEVYELAPG